MYSVQEAAAQIPATLFTAINRKMVLDACAAPGGKTVQLADLMENSGVITALDISKHRLGAMANHLERCHVSNTIVYNVDARQSRMLNRKFDRILLTSHARATLPPIKNGLAEGHWLILSAMRRSRKRFLAEASECLAAGGEMIYSTCSLEPEEDELNIDWAIQNLGLKFKKLIAWERKG